jgi:hypothetical protein
MFVEQGTNWKGDNFLINDKLHHYFYNKILHIYILTKSCTFDMYDYCNNCIVLRFNDIGVAPWGWKLRRNM